MCYVVSSTKSEWPLCHSSITSDSSQKNSFTSKAKCVTSSVCLETTFFSSNWIHRHYFGLKSWIILVNDAYHCFTPLSAVQLTALILVSEMRWMAQNVLLSQSLDVSSASSEMEPRAALCVAVRSKRLWKTHPSGLGYSESKGGWSRARRQLSDFHIDLGI